MRYLHIANVRLIDPHTDTDTITDVYVAHGRIQTIGRKPGSGEIEHHIDATGLWLTPAFIDLGAHLPEPGFSQKGSIASETLAACAAGFSHVCALPDSKPVADSSAVIQLIQEKSLQAGYAQVLPIGALTQGLAGEQIANLVTLTDAGCVALSNARQPIKDSYVLKRLMEYAATYGLRLFLHAHDVSLAEGGCMHEGATATRLGLAGIPETAETIALAQILLLAEQTGAQVHISQISCARSLTMLRQARQQGLTVSADVALANLVYTDEVVVGYNSQFNVQPPLRSETDRQALLAAVNQGELSISSNHQPHEVAAKKAPFADAQPGLSVYDCFVPLALALVREDELSLSALLRALSQQPGQLLGLSPALAENKPFSACLINPQAEQTISRKQLYSKGGNIPCPGVTLAGRVEHLFIDGQVVFSAREPA